MRAARNRTRNRICAPLSARVASPAGFEPTTYRLGICRSIRLSYGDGAVANAGRPLGGLLYHSRRHIIGTGTAAARRDPRHCAAPQPATGRTLSATGRDESRLAGGDAPAVLIGPGALIMAPVLPGVPLSALPSSCQKAGWTLAHGPVNILRYRTPRRRRLIFRGVLVLGGST